MATPPPEALGQPRSKLTRSAVWWALQKVVLDHASISAVAAVLQLAWGTVHDAVTELGARGLIDHPDRLDGVRLVGVDEHCWRHTRHGDKFVTVVIDLTPTRDGAGPVRLLDMAPGPLEGGVQDLAGGARTTFSLETRTKVFLADPHSPWRWQTRPLDRVYPVIIIDAIVLKIREGRSRTDGSTWRWTSNPGVSATSRHVDGAH